MSVEETHTHRPTTDYGASRKLRGVARRELKVFIIAGEHSGDALGGRLMAEINKQTHGNVRYLGVGGEKMSDAGLVSQFALEEVAVMGPMSILPHLPRIVRRVYQTVDAALAADPHVVVIIDSPEFTHPIAKRIRRKRPDIPIVDYVSPSVWAWRPGRAKRMRAYVDHILALLPFEPEAHQRLGGPACSYVGHPLIERKAWLDALDPAPLALSLRLDGLTPVVVVLPGSRKSEVARLFATFRKAIDLVSSWERAPTLIIPTVPSVRSLVEREIANWPVKVHLIEGEDDKFRAFKLADVALAASGTVTLELALAGTPAVVGYRVDQMAAQLKFLLKTPSIVLANLIAGQNIYPELIQERCTPVLLARALAPLLSDTPERQVQQHGLSKIARMMSTPGTTPSGAAAEIVLRYAHDGRDAVSADARD